MSMDSLSFRLDELTNADAGRSACTSIQKHTHTHIEIACTHSGSFYAADQRHPYAGFHSGLLASCFHVLLHPHGSIPFLNDLFTLGNKRTFAEAFRFIVVFLCFL